MSVVVSGRIGARGAQREVARLEQDLDNAHRLIHILVTREGGSTLITQRELVRTPTPWLTTQLTDDGLVVRAR